MICRNWQVIAVPGWMKGQSDKGYYKETSIITGGSGGVPLDVDRGLTSVVLVSFVEGGSWGKIPGHRLDHGTEFSPKMKPTSMTNMKTTSKEMSDRVILLGGSIISRAIMHALLHCPIEGAAAREAGEEGRDQLGEVS